MIPVGPMPVLPMGGDDSLDALRRATGKDGARMAARELTVTFLTQLLQAMRKTVPESDLLPRSESREVYDGMFDRAVAGAVAAGDPFGLEHRLAGAGFKGSRETVDTSNGEKSRRPR